MIDPAARTQDIKRQLDTVSATLHSLATEINLINEPYSAKTQVLACQMLLERIARDIDETFSIGEGPQDGAISRLNPFYGGSAGSTRGGALGTCRSRMNWSKGIRRLWIAVSLLWMICLIAMDLTLHPIGDLTGARWIGSGALAEATGADFFVSCISNMTTNCLYQLTSSELFYHLIKSKIQTLWVYAIIPPIGLLGLIVIGSWVHHGFVSANGRRRSRWDGTPYPVRRRPRPFQSWRELGHALREEFGRITRRREITPKMALTAIIAAALGWFLAAVANNYPQTPPQ